MSVSKALEFMTDKHRGQYRRDGTPYFLHPLRVSSILADLGIRDSDIKIAALLHDTIEKTKTTLDEINTNFGPVVADWVNLLSKEFKNTLSGTAKLEANKVYYKEVLAKAPVAVQLIKMADRIDNLRSLLGVKDALKWQQGYLQDTEEMLKVLSVKEVELLKAVLEETKNEFEKKFGSLLQQAGADTVTVEKSESNEIENTPAKDL